MGSSATPLVPVDTLTPDVYPPLEGTTVRAEDVAIMGKALLNLAWSLAYRYLGLEKTLVGPGGAWTNTIAGGDGAAMQTVDVNASIVAIPLPLRHGIKIRTIKVRVAPQVHVSLPVMPILRLYKITLTGTLDTTWTITDPSASVGVYNAAHDVTLDLGADEEIDKTGFYYLLQFVGEDGANEQTVNIGQPRIFNGQFAP